MEDPVTVLLIPQAKKNLEAAIARSGLSGTDIVNRAISLYEFADANMAAGCELILRDPAGGIWVIELDMPSTRQGDHRTGRDAATEGK